VGDLTGLRFGFADRRGEGVDEQCGADGDQLLAQLGGGGLGADRHLPAGVDAARVEALLECHHAHAGDLVAGEQCPLDRGRSPPPWQQREVQIDHRENVEDRRPDDLTERHHHAQLGAVGDRVVHVVDVV
jgi:hypothetical protein